MSAWSQLPGMQRARSWILRVTDEDIDERRASSVSYYEDHHDAETARRMIAWEDRNRRFLREDRDLLLFVDPADLTEDECFAVYRRLDVHGAGASEPLTLSAGELAERRARAVALIRSPGFDRMIVGEGVLSHLRMP